MSGALNSNVILGVGNLLRSDEGVGVHAVQALQAAGCEDKVALVDGGTAVFQALSAWDKIDKLIVIDAFQSGAEPGAVVRLSAREVADRTTPVLSLHQQGLLDSLALLRQAGLSLGEVVIFGVEPEAMGWGTELSASVAKAMPRLLEQIRAEAGLSNLEERSR